MSRKEINDWNWIFAIDFFYTFITELFFVNFVVGDSGSFLDNKIELVSTPNQGSFWRLNWGRLSMRLLRLLLDGQDWTCLVALFSIISLIIQGCSMVYYSIWPRNHTSHQKFYFNEFVANVMRDVIGIVIFDLKGHGGP